MHSLEMFLWPFQGFVTFDRSDIGLQHLTAIDIWPWDFWPQLHSTTALLTATDIWTWDFWPKLTFDRRTLGEIAILTQYSDPFSDVSGIAPLRSSANKEIRITRYIRKRVTVLTLLVGKWWDQIRGQKVSNK
jgi:hypothetical protein